MEVREILTAALAVVEDPRRWSSEYDWADASGQFVHLRSATVPSKFSVRGSIWKALDDAGVSREDQRAPSDACLAELMKTFIAELSKEAILEIKTHEEFAGGGGYLLLHHLGKIMKHGAILELFRKTVKRLRDENFATFQIEGVSHRVGDVYCDCGHCGGECPGHARYPRRCKCGGLLHLFIEPNVHDFYLSTVCDRCGYECEEVEPPRLVIPNV